MKSHFLKYNWSRLLHMFGVLSLLLFMSSLGHTTKIEAQEKEALTYLALGDSLTAGLGASETNYLRLNAFVPRLTKDLRAEYNVYVENHGIPGITSAQLLLYLQQGPGVQIKLEEANLITITIGGNDLLQLLRRSDLQPELIQTTIAQFGEQLKEGISLIRENNQDVPIYIMDLYTPYDEGHPLHTLGQLAISMYNQELKKQVGSMNQVHIISVYELFLGKGDQLTHIERNDIHPNDKGYEIIFKEFRKNIQ